ncbi:class B sortase [Butyribacter intestini]|jgi:sortase B|uniref:class B sortase n=1 Tax=Butyribacter intestini TaxID=1703332 RepID=UPI0022E451D4|nr:class B sortase [Butyribacter intestini]
MKKNMHKEKKKHKKNSKKRKQVGILFVLIGVLLILVFGFGEYQSYKSAIEIRKLQQLKEASSDNGNGIDTSKILPEYRNLYKTNSDLVGWLVVNGTQINYPVVQSTVYQEFYLDHNFDGENDESGAVFADARNDVFKPDDNVILYGHNMKNGSIFGTLQYYLDKSYYEKHKTMSFDTLYKRYDYQIVAVGLSKITDESADTFKYYDFLNAAGEKEFDNFKEKIKSLEVYDTGVKMKYGDKLITLSTCNSVEKNGRLFVIAKRN